MRYIIMNHLPLEHAAISYGWDVCYKLDPSMTKLYFFVSDPHSKIFYPKHFEQRPHIIPLYRGFTWKKAEEIFPDITSQALVAYDKYY